jgi:hypothetical protein
MPVAAVLSPPSSPSLQISSSTQRLACARTLDEEITSLHRRRNVDQAQIARRLAELHLSRGFLSLGFASVKAYARERLGWGAAKVKSLLELQARLGEQPRIRAAFEAGEVDWSKAVLASRAANKEPEREAEWLNDAQRLSSRELEAKVCGETGEKPRRERSFRLTPNEEAVLEEGLRALRTEGLCLEPGAALAELVRRALRGGTTGSSSYRFLLSRCPDCGRTAHLTGREELPVPSSAADRLLCDAEIQETRREPVRVTRTISPAVKNRVLARSKGCCEFPGCTNRGHLEFHHARGRGRGHDPDTIFCFCTAHHRAPHEGAVRIQGSWSTGVRFLRADGTLIGMAGGPAGSASRDASEAPEPVASRDAESVAEPAASRDAESVAEPAASRDASTSAQTCGVKTHVDPRGEQALALEALKRLEFPARRAKSLLLEALAERPALREAGAAELVRAVLTRC